MKREINYLSAAVVGAFLALMVAAFQTLVNDEPLRSVARYAGNGFGGALLACGIAWLANRYRTN